MPCARFVSSPILAGERVGDAVTVVLATGAVRAAKSRSRLVADRLQLTLLELGHLEAAPALGSADEAAYTISELSPDRRVSGAAGAGLNMCRMLALLLDASGVSPKTQTRVPQGCPRGSTIGPTFTCVGYPQSGL